MAAKRSCRVSAYGRIHLLEIPAQEAIQVVFLVYGERTRSVGTIIDTALLIDAQGPVLLGGVEPEGQKLLKVIIPTLFRLLVDEPNHLDLCVVDPFGRKPDGNTVVATGMVPEVRQHAQAKGADVGSFGVVAHERCDLLAVQGSRDEAIDQ